MALANVACLLARSPTEGDVLMVDWDLEAPGLHRFFRDRCEQQFGRTCEAQLEAQPGLIELFQELDGRTRSVASLTEEAVETLLDAVPLEPFLLSTDIPGLWLLKAGCFDQGYAARVNSFDWEEFYRRSPCLIRMFAERLAERFRYVLIDSRTGLTDTSGICTMLMPEKLVVVFTPNRQSLYGVLSLIREAVSYRRQSDDLRPLVVFPLASRIETAEPGLHHQWRFGAPERGLPGYQPQFEELFREIYDLPQCPLDDYFGEVQIQHASRYAYGEAIAVLSERGADRLSLTRSYESFTERLRYLTGPWEDWAAFQSQRMAEEQSRLAEETLARLGPEALQTARMLFTRLTRVALPEEGGEDTRARVSVSELSGAARQLLLDLNEAGLIAVERDVRSGERTAQVTHEALIRGWDRLRNWIEEDRAFLLWRQHLRTAMIEWERSRHDPDALLRGAVLTEAARQLAARSADLTSPERDFIQVSQQHEAQEKQRLEHLYQHVDRQLQINLARQLAAQSELIRHQSPHLLSLSVLLAAEAVRRSPSVEAVEALRSALALLPRVVADLSHDGVVRALTFSPDGRYLATGSSDFTVRVWDLANGAEVGQLSHAGPVTALAFSGDGRLLSTAGPGQIARVWEWAVRRQVSHLPLKEPLGALALAPGGRYLAATGRSRMARLWDMITGDEVARLRPREPLTALAFSPDGRYLAAAGDDRSLWVWAMPRVWQLARLRHPGPALAVAVSVDGKHLATAGQDRFVRLWDWTSGREVSRLSHDGDTGVLAFSPDGRYLAMAGDNPVARVWEVADGEGREVARMSHGTALLTGIAFSPDGGCLASAGNDRSVRVWRHPSNGTAARSHHAQQRVLAAAFSPDGRHLATVGEDQIAYLWDVEGGQELARVPLADSIRSLVLGREPRHLAVLHSDRTVRMWSWKDTREAACVAFGQGITKIAVSPEGRYLAATGEDASARVWEIESGREEAALAHGSVVDALAFSPQGQHLATGSRDGLIRVWGLPEGQELARFPQATPVTALAFSPAGGDLIATSEDESARIWAWRDGRQSAVMLHAARQPGVACSMDGEYLATLAAEATIRVWETASGREVARLTHNGDVLAVAFAAEGRLLAAVSADGNRPTWLWRPQELLEETCARLTRNLTREEWREYLGEEPYRRTCPNLPDPPALK